jgi:hypothetical protein
MVKKNLTKNIKNLSQNKNSRQDKWNMRQVVTCEKKVSVVVQKRLEKEQKWKENKLLSDNSLHKNITKIETKKVTEYKLQEEVNKKYIWDFFWEYTKIGSRNNERKNSARSSVNKKQYDAIKEYIKDNNLLSTYFNEEDKRRFTGNPLPRPS